MLSPRRPRAPRRRRPRICCASAPTRPTRRPPPTLGRSPARGPPWSPGSATAGCTGSPPPAPAPGPPVRPRWLGYASPEGPARARRFRPAGPGYLLLCSDGVWNHIPDADRLAALLTGDDVLADARALVDAALADGGHDNATVALLPLDPADGEGEWDPRPDGSDDTGPILIPLDGDDDWGDDGWADDDRDDDEDGDDAPRRAP